MFPELFKIPGTNIPISTYGLLYAIAIVLGLWITANLAAKDRQEKAKIYDLGLYIVASALIGSKVLMAITEWHDYRGDLVRLFSLDFWRSGGVYFGGFIAAVLTSIFLMRRWKMNWRKTADAFAPGIAIGHAIGRIGCFSAGCCWGKATTSWIGVKFPEKAGEVTGVPTDVALIPTQLIEAAANLIIFGLLLLLWKRRKFDGQIIFTYFVLYSIARFTIEFWRDDPRGSLLGLSTSQLISLVFFILGIVLLIYHWRRSNDKKLTSHKRVATQVS
jgi:phosphatidylglycerol---prolipoprotein diacylglyceryl transferase